MKRVALIDKVKEYKEILQWMLTREKQDEFVEKYCKDNQLSLPEPWCYIGEVLWDSRCNECFVVLNVKDLAEIRRRRVSYSKIDIKKLTERLKEREGDSAKLDFYYKA